jgi:site-specific recombinase XerD
MSTPTQPKKLLERVSETLRLKHYSRHTETSYLAWIKRFILFHHKRHPQEMGGPEIETFLTHLAVNEHIAASTQNQALSALLFLYRDVLRQELDYPIDAIRAKKPHRLPVVLTKIETLKVIRYLSGPHQLTAKLLYGSGLRLMECVRLRVQDIDFAQHQVLVRDGKGDKDRLTILPDSLIQPLQAQLHRVKTFHQDDLAEG